MDCAKVRPDVCRAVLDAALAQVPGSTAPNRAILGPPFERHYVVGGGSFGGTVLFLFEDGRQVLVLVRLAEGQGVHAEVWRGPIPTWYPTPRA